MTEPPPLCMMCKSPMAIVHAISTPKANNIAVWRCLSCPMPKFVAAPVPKKIIPIEE